MTQTKDSKININLNCKSLEDAKITKTTVKVITETTYKIDYLANK